MNLAGLRYRIDSSVALQAKDPDTGEMVDVLFWKRNEKPDDMCVPPIILIHPDNRARFERAFPKVTRQMALR